jgi:two-component system chemotaxis response regulator CheY
MLPSDDQIADLMASRKVLVIDDEPYTRKVIRTLLISMGVTRIQEASDGHAGLDVVCTFTPDIVLCDWSMSGLDGPGFVRAVRSPDTFPYPDVPIIMLTGHGERSRVMQAAKLGVHEYILKPVSSQALQARMLSVINNPRKMVRKGDYYGPEPRKTSAYKPAYDPEFGTIVMLN